MPNHVHLVVFLEGNTQANSLSNRFGRQLPNSLGMVIGAFKSAVKRQIDLLRGEITLVWQPRFYDRVVRSEAELTNIRRYIENNPVNWLNDRCHPQHPNFELAWRGYAPHDDLPDLL
jgi:REP element-mobilizing transposase RayT